MCDNAVMRVAAVQFKARADPEAGRAALAEVVRHAAQNADLIVCPEMAISGYGFENPESVAGAAEEPDGPTARALRAAAGGAWVVYGFPERDGTRLFNSAAILAPDGRLHGVYRKRLLFEADESWATPGDRDYPLVETEAGRFGVGICMDLNDDRFLEWCATAALDAIAFPTNWIQEDGSVWDYWRWRLYTGWPVEAGVPQTVLQRRRVDAVLVGANSYGAEGAWMLRGESAILSWNRAYATASTGGDAVLTATIPVR